MTSDDALVTKIASINDTDDTLNGGKMREITLSPSASGDVLPVLRTPSGSVTYRRKIYKHNIQNTVLSGTTTVTNPEVTTLFSSIRSLRNQTSDVAIAPDLSDATSSAGARVCVTLCGDENYENSFDFENAPWSSFGYITGTPVPTSYFDVHLLDAENLPGGSRECFRVGQIVEIHQNVGTDVFSYGTICEIGSLTGNTIRLYIKPRTSWLKSTTYAVGKVIKPTSFASTSAYLCVSAGTSGTSEPTWLTTGVDIADGTVTWRYLGEAPVISATADKFVPDGNLARVVGYTTGSEANVGVTSLTNTSSAGIISSEGVTLYNRTTRTKTATLTFLSSSTFSCVTSDGETLATGNIFSDYNAYSPDDLSSLYFTIPAESWSGTFVVGDVVTITMKAAAESYWLEMHFDNVTTTGITALILGSVSNYNGTLA